MDRVSDGLSGPRRPSKEVLLEQWSHSGGGNHVGLWREDTFATGALLQGQRPPGTAWHFQGAEKRLVWLARGTWREQ